MNLFSEGCSLLTLAIIIQHKLRNASLKSVYDFTFTHIAVTKIIHFKNAFSSHLKCSSSLWSMVSETDQGSLPDMMGRMLGCWELKKKVGRWKENAAEGERVVSPYTCPLCQTSANSCVKSIHFAGKRCAILHHQHRYRAVITRTLSTYRQTSICDLFDDAQIRPEPVYQRE
jgi:hypothetical protein